MTEYLHVLVLALLVFLVFAGVEVAVSLGIVSLVAMLISTGDWEITVAFLSNTAYEALRDYVFAVVPLFLLMGEFIARSGIAYDLFWAIDRWLSRLPARLAFATVLGNVVFSFVSGTSLASATTFTSIAYPHMKRSGYADHFSLGLISGSACLGMLIPPSLLMVVWGILTDISIGHLFLAGIIPGFLLAGLMMAYIAAVAVVRPRVVAHGIPPPASTIGSANAAKSDQSGPSQGGLWLSAVGLLAIVVGALGGIWAGFFTPTEGAGMGALVALLVGVLKGMRAKEIIDVVITVGRVAVPLMILVFAAQLYSRTLAMSGIGSQIQALIMSAEWSVGMTVLFMVGIWLVLGMFVDSISIMLLTVPIFWPIAKTLGVDPLAFAMIGILVVEAGLLTPPFGLVVFAVKSVVPNQEVTMSQIFTGAMPFMVLLLVVSFLIYVFPQLANWLASWV
jgi:tripartite ATP-independent transporter DctM subunit